jgi:hypothetical protein
MNATEDTHSYFYETGGIDVSVSRQSGPCLLLAASLLMLMVVAWLYAAVAGCSITLAQVLGTAYVAVIGFAVMVSVLRDPTTIVRPVNVFLISSVYLLVLDTATLRYVHAFSPELLLSADTVIGVYLVAVLGTCYLWQARTFPVAGLLRGADENLTGSTYFWIVILIFALEYLVRLASVGFNLHELFEVMLSAKNIQDPNAGIAFRRGPGGGWDVIFTPIDSLFLVLTVFVDRAWKRGISGPKKLILAVLTVTQLVTIILGGAKGSLLIAVSLPLVIRAAQHDEASARWIASLVLASFLLAPLMDTMTQVRAHGWSAISEVHHVSRTLLEAPRDDNFRWTVALTAYLEDGPGVLAYRGPLGFVAGLRTVLWDWLITPVPRILWPGKPEPWKRLEPGRPWNASESAVGDLLRYGGVSFVIAGGLFMGFWLSLLEPLYLIKKNDGAAIVYGYLQIVTAGFVRTTSVGPAISPLMTCILIWWLSKSLGAFTPSNAETSENTRLGEAYIA